jgi:hypothetical protein
MKVGCVLIAVLALVGITTVAVAAEPGWNLRTDPRGRAFLSYVDAESGAAFLTLRCLDDVETIGIAVEGLGLPKKGKEVVLSSDGGGSYRMAGTVTVDGDTTDFDGELDSNLKRLQNFARLVNQILGGDDTVMIAVGGSNVAEISPIDSRKILKRFGEICFHP